MTEKLLLHQFDEPEPLQEVRRARLQTFEGPNGPVHASEAMMQVPGPVVEVVCRLMAKRPEDRYQTPLELANVLQSLLKQMADGSLPHVIEGVRDDTDFTLSPTVCAPRVEAAELPPTVSDPIVRFTGKTARLDPEWKKWAFAAAISAGVVFVLMAGMLGALLSRGDRTQAAPGPHVKGK